MYTLPTVHNPSSTLYPPAPSPTAVRWALPAATPAVLALRLSATAMSAM